MSRRRDDDRTDEPEPEQPAGLVLEQLELFDPPTDQRSPRVTDHDDRRGVVG